MACLSFLRLWAVYCLILPSTSLTFDIERQPSDFIPNDFEIANGIWKKIPCRNSCTQFNTGYVATGICKCTCKYAYSTFRMGATPQQSSCIKNEDIRTQSGCKIDFESFSASNQVPVLKNSGLGLKIRSNHPYRCKIKGKPQYWDRGKWITVSGNLFELKTQSGQYLKWKNSVISYHGRLMRQYIDNCKRQSKSCVVFKAEGTLKYNITVPTTTTAVTTATTATTAITATTVTTATTATLATTATTATTGTAATVATTATTTTLATTVTTATTGTTATAATLATSTITTAPVVTTVPIVTEKPSVTESNVTTTNVIPIITDKPVTETTEKPTTKTEDPGGEKGAHGSGSTSGDNTLMIAVIAAVAAIACVIIICVFVWFVMKRMRRREDKAYSSNMTVITNATGTNNTMSDGSAYCEPTEQHSHFPKQLSKIGNPVYAKAMIHGGRSNNSTNLPKATNGYKDTNYHDNHAMVDSGEYGNPTYQDIMPVKQDNSEYDNYYVEPEKPIYEELPDKNIRDSMYQPLIRDSQVIQGDGTEIPEYLAIINEDPSNHSNKQTIPEYLTIIPDNDSQSAPTRSPSLDYDYAIPEEQMRTTLKAPNGTRLCHPSEDGPKTSDQEPMYDVLEAPDTVAGDEYMTPIDDAPSSKC